MGSDFIDKHKRKSVIALLLLFLRSRGKYAVVLVVVALLSMPFIISGEVASRFVQLPSVSYLLRTFGLGSVVSTINPKYSNDLLKAAMDKAVLESKQGTFWNKFLSSVNETLPAGGGPSSIALVRGGGDMFGPPELEKGRRQRFRPNQVKGVVNEQERARGDTGDEVNLQGLLSKVANGGGLYGDLMGEYPGEGGGASVNAGPYMASLGGAGPSVVPRAAGMYSSVIGQTASKIPVPGSPGKAKVKKMGKVSGFSWKNMGYKTQSSKQNVKLNSKNSMFQLAETFAMTGSAYTSENSAPEYQAAYVGSTYDGNNSGLDAMDTGGGGVVAPDNGFAGDLITNTGGLQQQADDCAAAQGTNGAKMSEDGEKMDEVAKTMGDQPDCCDSGVGAWNQKVDKIEAYCDDYNTNETILAAKCQTVSNQMDCGSYAGMHIDPCSDLECFFAILLVIITLGLLLGLIALVSVAVSIAVGIGLFGGGAIIASTTDWLDDFIGKIAGGLNKM